MAGDGDTGSHMPDICLAPRRLTVATMTSGNATHGVAPALIYPTRKVVLGSTNTIRGVPHP